MIPDDFYGYREAREQRRIDDPREPSDFRPGDEPERGWPLKLADAAMIGKCFEAIDQARSEDWFEQGGHDEQADDIAYVDAREAAEVD